MRDIIVRAEGIRIYIEPILGDDFRYGSEFRHGRAKMLYFVLSLIRNAMA